MRPSLFCCLFWPLLVCVNDLRAQTKVIEVDTLTGLPKERLPFDEPFALKIPVTGKRVHSVSYMRVNQSRGIDKALKVNRIRTLDSRLVSSPKKIDGKNYVIAQFRNPYLLSPGKQYMVFWAEDVSDKVMKFFDLYDAYQRAIRTSTEAATKKAAEDAYNQLVADNKEAIGVEWGFTTITSGSFDANIKNYYNPPPIKKSFLKLNKTPTGTPSPTIKDKYVTYRYALSDFEAIFPSLRNLQSTVTGNGSLETLQRYLASPSTTLDTSARKRYVSDPRKAITQLSQLINLSSDDYEKLTKGLIDINCDNCTPAETGMIEKRDANLNTTLAAIESLYAIAIAFRVSGQTNLNGAEIALKDFWDQLRSIIKELEKDKGVIIARKAIRDAVFNVGLSEPRWLSADSYVPTFETRTKLSITPDLGVITTRLWKDRKEPWDDKNNPYPFVPYLGFQINLRPINRDVSFWSYRHTGLSHKNLRPT